MGRERCDGGHLRVDQKEKENLPNNPTKIKKEGPPKGHSKTKNISRLNRDRKVTKKKE